METPVRIRAVDAGSFDGVRAGLARLLVDSVANGASIGFLDPLGAAEAEAYWRGIERAVGDGRCLLLVAELGGELVGTVQLDVDTLPNQPHRATVCKLLVHSAARRRGVGEALMAELERAALGAGRWLLTLDTATGAAERLYAKHGWTRVGPVPDYAQNPDGSLTPTVFFWKRLAGD